MNRVACFADGHLNGSRSQNVGCSELLRKWYLGWACDRMLEMAGTPQSALNEGGSLLAKCVISVGHSFVTRISMGGGGVAEAAAKAEVFSEWGGLSLLLNISVAEAVKWLVLRGSVALAISSDV